MLRPVLASLIGTLVLNSGLMAMSATNHAQKTFALTKPSSPIRVATVQSMTSLEQKVQVQVNQYRASRNLLPLTLDSRISAQARAHSQAMAAGTTPFGHEGFSQRVQAIAKSIPYSAAAENVAYNQGYSDPVTQAVQGWLHSTGHRTNIEGQYDLTGVGIAKNSKGEYYFTQMFIRRR